MVRFSNSPSPKTLILIPQQIMGSHLSTLRQHSSKYWWYWERGTLCVFCELELPLPKVLLSDQYLQNSDLQLWLLRVLKHYKEWTLDKYSMYYVLNDNFCSFLSEDNLFICSNYEYNFPLFFCVFRKLDPGEVQYLIGEVRTLIILIIYCQKPCLHS